MKRPAKPEREFSVSVPYHGRATIVGETFFAARAAAAVFFNVEPLAIRLDPPARFS